MAIRETIVIEKGTDAKKYFDKAAKKRVIQLEKQVESLKKQLQSSKEATDQKVRQAREAARREIARMKDWYQAQYRSVPYWATRKSLNKRLDRLALRTAEIDFEKLTSFIETAGIVVKDYNDCLKKLGKLEDNNK